MEQIIVMCMILISVILAVQLVLVYRIGIRKDIVEQLRHLQNYVIRLDEQMSKDREADIKLMKSLLVYFKKENSD